MEQIIDKKDEQMNQNKEISSKKVKAIDFNCDLAQGFGVYKNKIEFDFLDYVSSVNIATGFHTGDPLTIKDAILKAKEKNIVIGANIGFNDLQGFGMRAVSLSEEEIEALVIYQVGALISFAKAYGLEVEYVRPHGAMYQLASENFTFSCAIAKAVKKCSQWLTYVGAAGDIINKVRDFVKIQISREITLSHVYKANGSIDFKIDKINDYNLLIRKLQRYLYYSQIDNTASGNTFIEADTIHFDTNEASLTLIKKANELIIPKPVNFNNVESSGWV